MSCRVFLGLSYDFDYLVVPNWSRTLGVFKSCLLAFKLFKLLFILIKFLVDACLLAGLLLEIDLPYPVPVRRNPFGCKDFIELLCNVCLDFLDFNDCLDFFEWPDLTVLTVFYDFFDFSVLLDANECFDERPDLSDFLDLDEFLDLANESYLAI